MTRFEQLKKCDIKAFCIHIAAMNYDDMCNAVCGPKCPYFKKCRQMSNADDVVCLLPNDAKLLEIYLKQEAD